MACACGRGQTKAETHEVCRNMQVESCGFNASNCLSMLQCLINHHGFVLIHQQLGSLTLMAHDTCFLPPLGSNKKGAVVKANWQLERPALFCPHGTHGPAHIGTFWAWKDWLPLPFIAQLTRCTLFGGEGPSSSRLILEPRSLLSGCTHSRQYFQSSCILAGYPIRISPSSALLVYFAAVSLIGLQARKLISLFN